MIYQILKVILFIPFILYSLFDILSFISWMKSLKRYNWNYKELKDQFGWRDLDNKYYSHIYVGITMRLICNFIMYRNNKVQNQLYIEQFKLIKSIEACKKEYKL